MTKRLQWQGKDIVITLSRTSICCMYVLVTSCKQHSNTRLTIKPTNQVESVCDLLLVRRKSVPVLLVSDDKYLWFYVHKTKNVTRCRDTDLLKAWEQGRDDSNKKSHPTYP